MIQPAVHILHGWDLFCLAVSFISLFHSISGKSGDLFVFQEYTDLHQEMVGGGYLGLPVKIIQFLPAEGRIMAALLSAVRII